MLGADHSAFQAPLDALPVPSTTDVALQPGKGMFFDEFIEIRDPEGAALMERVLEAVDAVRSRQRKRNRAAQANHIERIHRLLANALRVHFFRTQAAVLYFRKADAEWYEDSPLWMRHGTLGEAVDALVDAGLLGAVTGRKMPYGSPTPSSASSYGPIEALICMAWECGITTQSIGRRIPAEQLVRLFGPKPQAEFDWLKGGLVQHRKGKRITFEPTTETAEWTANLAAINAFYRQHEISLGLTPEQLNFWIVERNADPDRTGTPFRTPETFAKDVYRVFNNGDKEKSTFDHGGRLYGGWWIHTPGELREAITINGQPTVELDYSNCFPRMLYAERGLDCDGDLYELPEIAACEADTGVAPGTYRGLIKWLMQVLLNGKRRPSENEKPDHLALPPGFSVGRVAALLEARHQPIANAFKTGAGFRLMRLESDIALEIITTAMAEGWVVLSVHDSFITTINRQDQLKELMIHTYYNRLKREPHIK